MMKKLLCTLVFIVASSILAYSQNVQVTGLGNVIPGDETNTPIVSDDTDFGALNVVGESVTHTFTITNNEAFPVLVTVNEVFGVANTNGFSFTDVTNGSLAASGGSTTFTVTFDPSTPAGLKSDIVNIDVLELGGGFSSYSYNFNIQGTAIETIAPDIDISGNGITIVNGDFTPSSTDDTDFGPQNIASGSISRTYTITNYGSAPLNLTNASLVVISGGGGAFTVSGLPTTPIAQGDNSDFEISFDPSVVGVVTANLVVQSDDPDESNYVFRIQGEGIEDAPEISIVGNGVEIITPDFTPSTTDDTNFGQQDIVSGSITRTFTITNTGSADLNLTNAPIVLVSGGAGAFTVTNFPSSVITPNNSSTFDVSFDPSVEGVVTANIVVQNDDSDEPNYIFRVQGEGISVPIEPEINLLDNSNANLTSGGSVDYGTQNVSSGSQTFTFTIQNTGTSDLSLTGASPFVTISGANASDFTLGTVPSSTITASGSTTFTITFDPSDIGARTASVSIANDDSDENPYTFTLTGEGIDASAGSPLLITQYYENGSKDYIEVKNISLNTVPQQFYLCLYTDDLDLASISASSPVSSIQIPELDQGDVVVYKNPTDVSGNGIATGVCDFDGNDVILISTTNDNTAFNNRRDIIGVVGNPVGPLWGANTSFIKGCGTSQSPTLNFSYNSSSNIVTDYIQLTTDEVDTASGTNLVLGIQTAIETTWTSSWSDGIPDKTKSAIINGAYVSTDGSFESCDLTINPAGSINFTGTSNFVKVNNDLAINGSFILGDQAALVTVNTLANITGVIEKQESSTTLKQFDFTYWSSPVEGANVSVFGSAPPERIFEWRKPSSGDFGGWVVKNGVLEVGRGYISEGPDGATQHNLNFIGKPNNGTVTVSVGFDNTSLDGAGGYNLVGNPYPCAIDIEKFLGFGSNGEIRTNNATDGTVWLWTHATEYQDNPEGENDYVVSDYVTYNVLGGVGQPGPVSKNIGSAQGFFVRAKQSGNVFFQNEMKLDGQNTQFFRDANLKKNSINMDKIWLDVTSLKGGAFNQILIGFSDKATDDNDIGFDALKFSAGNYIKFYSNIGDKKYAIQGLGSYTSDKKVSIGFDSTIKEEFLISINRLEGALNDEEIYLVDNYLNIVHDLKASDYKFEITETGSFADRFTLQFNKSVLSVGEEELANSFIVSNDNEDLRVKAGTNITDIKVYDILGRLLISQKPNKSDFRIKSSIVSDGAVLIVNATLDNGVEVSKKVIKH